MEKKSDNCTGHLNAPLSCSSDQIQSIMPFVIEAVARQKGSANWKTLEHNSGNQASELRDACKANGPDVDKLPLIEFVATAIEEAAKPPQ